MSYSLVVIGVAAVVILCDNAAAESDIKFVQLYFRHGDRAPTLVFPGDPFDSARQWPQGLDALTPLGVAQQHALGRFLRQRYADDSDALLPSNYTQKHVYYYSSAAARCIRSAMANAAGFFPPDSAEQQWATDGGVGSVWQPVPVYSVPDAYDYVNARAECPELQKLLVANFQRGEELVRERYPDVFEVLENNTGIRPLNIFVAFQLWDAIITQRSHQLFLPWLNSTFFHQRLLPALYDFQTIGIEESQRTRLFIGRLLGVLFERFRLASEVSTHPMPGRRLIAYSGHDINAMDLVFSLGAGRQVSSTARFSTCVILELYRNDSMALFYKNLTSWGDEAEQVRDLAETPAQQMRWTMCDGALTCARTTVERHIADWRVDSDEEMREACGVEEEAKKEEGWSWLLIGVATMGWVALAVLATVVLCNRKEMPSPYGT